MSTASISNRLSSRDLTILAASVILVCSAYLLFSRLDEGLGFPLDDSWIHQTYARNLAQSGEWSFRPGAVTAGSTSPLWTGLLAIGFLLRLSPYFWSYLLGGAILFLLGMAGEEAVRRSLPAYRPRLPWVGMFIVSEWHLVWAGLSGMETLLHAYLATVVLVALMNRSSGELILGLLAGLSVWVRPDGLTLLAPIGLALVLTGDRASIPARLVRLLIGFTPLVLFYLVFNLMTGGTPMPNTYYAKQAEYAVWQSQPMAARLGQMALQISTGPSLILLPGFLYWIIGAIRGRRWGHLAAMAWCIGYLVMYTARLPVYQHGRYLMPALPGIFLAGFMGLIDLVGSGPPPRRVMALIHRAWVASLAALALVFIPAGARVYARDVALIETEMVATAKWVQANLPREDVIAAHDIGALGFFDAHELIDLAGLISPEVIPILRDEARLAAFLDEAGADYLITFPEFYEVLTREREIVFTSRGAPAREAGHGNMQVYRWDSP